MERQAFMDAVAQHQDMVYRVALHWFGVPQDAEDAVQEVFLRLYLREKPFDGPEHLRRWLLRVTVQCLQGRPEKSLAEAADALDAIYKGKLLQAVCILEQAQRKTEEMAIEKDMIWDFP